jgi:hypothetical protein
MQCWQATRLACSSSQCLPALMGLRSSGLRGWGRFPESAGKKPARPAPMDLWGSGSGAPDKDRGAIIIFPKRIWSCPDDVVLGGVFLSGFFGIRRVDQSSDNEAENPTKHAEKIVGNQKHKYDHAQMETQLLSCGLHGDQDCVA